MTETPAEKIINQEDFARANPQSDFYESEEYLVKYLHSLRLRAIIRLVKRVLTADGEGGWGKVIELGCGDGYVLQALSRSLPDVSLTGIDSNPVRINRARNLLGKIELRQEKGEKTFFPPASFRVCVCSEVLEHVPDDRSLLREICRLLEPGGFAVITTPNLWTLPNKLKKFRGRAPEIWVPDHRREYSRRELINKVRTVGFTIISFRSIGFFIPRMHLFARIPILVKLIFSLAHLFPSWGRDFIILAQKKEVT